MPKGMGYGSHQPINAPKVGPTPVKGQEINIKEARKGSATSPHNGTNS